MNADNIEKLKEGGVGVVPTDTVYGLACSAFSESALKRMFDIKGRSEHKPPVVIISSLEDLGLFGIKPNDLESKFISQYWPGGVTIIFKIKEELSFLDQGMGLAIRLPNNEKIISFLKQTGPLATTSANHQGQPIAKNIVEAKKYFGDQVDFYEDGGNLNFLPSTLVRLKDDKIEVLREGAVKIKC